MTVATSARLIPQMPVSDQVWTAFWDSPSHQKHQFPTREGSSFFVPKFREMTLLYPP